MDFNYWGGAVWVINVIFFFILRRTRRIGNLRSGGISGWISLLVGLLILTISQVSPFNSFSSPFLLIIAIISLIAILFIYLSALTPQTNLNWSGKISSLSIRLGIFMGVIIGAIIAFFT